MATATFTPIVNYILAVGPAESDAALLARFAQTNDESAFAVLVRRHGSAVLGVCRRVLRDGHSAEDAFQATFLLLARKAGTLSQPERLANWLYGVAYRTATKLRTRLSRRQSREHPFDESAIVQPDDPDSELGPELDAAIQQLPSKYRVPFVLCYLQGLTNAEAAAHLGCPTNTVATRLSRARERLRFRLTNRGLTVAVSASLVAATARGAAALAAGTAGPSLEILTLMEGVRNAMIWNKVKLVATTVVVLALTGIGAGRLAFRADAEPPAVGTPSNRTTAPPNPAVAVRPPLAQDDRIPPLDLTAPELGSKNFIVTGTTPENCRRITFAAEIHRKKLAKIWLGKDLPDWPTPCPIKVTIDPNGSTGATTFAFDNGSATPTQMTLTGPLERILIGSLPHEVAHTVLAAHFLEPVPRWADEGVALLSEDATEQSRHDQLMTKLLNDGRAMRLTSLFRLKEYPSDVMTLFAQGFSVTRFLVKQKDRPTFLEFVKVGLKFGWDAAAFKCYGFRTVNELESAWIESLRKSAREPQVGDPTWSSNLPPPLPPPVSPPPLSDIVEPTTPQPLPAPPLVPTVELQRPAIAVEIVHDAVGWGVPTVVLASVDKDGMLVCKFSKKIFYEPMSSDARAKAGNVGTARTSYVRKSIHEDRCYRLDQVQIIETNGKPVEGSDLVKRLDKETAVLFIQSGTVSPQLLPLLKEGTLIIRFPPVPPIPVTSAPPGAPAPAIRE